MWIKEIDISEIRKDGRWKVELFTDILEKKSSVYTMIKVGDLVRERKENIKPFLSPSQEFNYIGLENIMPITGELISFNTKKGEEIKSVSKIFSFNDILYGRLRPNLNKAYLADNNSVLSKGICSGEFHVLIPDTFKILPNYLRTILSSKYIQSYVKFMQTGSALPRLSLKDLYQIEIPVPPMSIQQELENKLIIQSNKIKKLRAELASLPIEMIDEIEKITEKGFDHNILYKE
ncbi:restriction endonuclease subunit S [Bacillus tropicus]|uniref:restriction endonuclease subunit S n=1 Tax=Bacillus tropicus TaxID=2026188 RepID=UPI0016429EFF|nr:restriction endonuclease subunit S [Bacillus tropicus]